MREDGQLHREHSVCVQQGLTTPATLTDHIVPHCGAHVLFWQETNLQSLCGTCHGMKEERGRFGRDVRRR